MLGGNTEDDIATELELSRNIRGAREYLAALDDLGAEEICELHRLLFTTAARSPKRPGAYRTGGGRAKFGRDIGPPGHLVGYEMETFVEETSLLKMVVDQAPDEARDGFRLVAVAYLHARLVWIHPFGDGNGRSSRLVAEFQGRQFFDDPGIAWFSASDRGDLMAGYNDALSSAGRENDLGPLCQVFASTCNRKLGPLPSPAHLRAPFEVICEQRILGPSHKVPPYDLPSYLSRRLRDGHPFERSILRGIGA